MGHPVEIKFLLTYLLTYLLKFSFSFFVSSFTPNEHELTRRRGAIWALCVFQAGESASPYILVENEDIWVIAERDWGLK